MKWGKKLNLTVTSFFSNGKKVTATSQFIYQKDFKLSTIAGEDWNTLLQNAAHSGGVNNSQIKLPLQLQWTANTGSNIFYVFSHYRRTESIYRYHRR